MKYAVVGPHSWFDLLVHPHALRCPFACSCLVRRGAELPILRRPTLGRRQWLVHDLRVCNSGRLWDVMTLIDERRSAIFESISVRRPWSYGHQDHGVVPAEPEVHA